MQGWQLAGGASREEPVCGAKCAGGRAGACDGGECVLVGGLGRVSGGCMYVRTSVRFWGAEDRGCRRFNVSFCDCGRFEVEAPAPMVAYRTTGVLG